MPAKAPPRAGADALNRRICVLVVGPHRSGTSALTRTLSLLGCDLPATLMDAGEGNESGHWESDEIYRLNEDLLASAGSRWDDWRPFNASWYQSVKLGEFHDRARELLVREFGDSRLFVLKDPRINLLVPFWTGVLESLGIEPVAVFAVRNPVEVARSLERRDGLDRALSRLIWLRHILDAEAALRGRSRAFCTFDQLMGEWPQLIERLQDSLGLVLPRTIPAMRGEVEAFLRRDLRHHASPPERTIGNPAETRWLREVFGTTTRWAEQAEDPADHAALDAIRAAFDAAAEALGEPLENARRSERALRAEADGLRSESTGRIAALEAQVSELGGALAQREQDGEALQRRVADLQAALGTVGGREADATRTAEALRAELAQTQSQLVNAQATLDETRAGSEGLREQLAEATMRQVALEQANDALRQAERTLQDSLAQQTSALEQRRAELADTLDQIRAIEQQARLRERELQAELAETRSFREREQQEFEQTRAEQQARIVAAEHDLADSRQSLDRRFEELAQLSRMVLDSEESVAAQRSKLSRVQEIAAILMRPDRFGRWLPAALGRRRQLAMLRKRALFDSSAYLERNPDVGEDGMDPLLHFIVHGIAEGRPTGLDPD